MPQMMIQVEKRPESSAYYDTYGMPAGYISSTNPDGTSSVRIAQQALRSNHVRFPEGVSTIMVAVYSTRLQSWYLVGEHPSKVGYDGAHVPPETRTTLWGSTSKLQVNPPNGP